MSLITAFVRPALVRLPDRTFFCEGMDGTRPCEVMATVQMDTVHLCRAHAIESLNAVHQAAVEEVNRVAREEPVA